MHGSPVLLFAALALRGSGVVAQTAAACPGGRYVVPPADVVVGDAPRTVITLQGNQVAIEGTCPPAPARVHLTRHGTDVTVRWPACHDGTARLRARIDFDCAGMHGVFMPRPGHRWRFVAGTTHCGDDLVDTGAGEQCDPPGFGSCLAGCVFALPPPTTTTTIPSLCGNARLDAGEDCDPPGIFCAGFCDPVLQICADAICAADCTCPAGERCGVTLCARGETCCNPLLGICTPPGVGCIETSIL